MDARVQRPGHAGLVACLLGGSVLVSGCTGGALSPAGTAARTVADLWWVMLAAAAAVYLLVVGLLLFAGLRRGRDQRGPGAADGERAGLRFVVWGGVVLPAVVLSALLVGFVATTVALPRGEGTLDVRVVGHQFWWEVRYEDEGIVTANELHVPAGEQVRVRLSSRDVIHSVWVPRLAGKRDLVPGEETVLVLDAEEPGTYRGQCAEYCGIQHANMALLVVAHPPEEFAAWVEEAAEPPPDPDTAAARRGRDEFMEAGCAACHAISGTPADGDVGPDLSDFASRATIGAGTAPNSRGHLGGWVVNSQTLKPGNRMPPQDVDPQRLGDLLDYLETLR